MKVSEGIAAAACKHGNPVSSRSHSSSGAFADTVGTYTMVAAVIISSMFVLDPAGLGSGLLDRPVVKYLPVELAIASIPWFALGRQSRVRPPGVMFAFTAAALLVFAGATYTILVLHNAESDSFLGRALGMLVVFAGYALAMRPWCWTVLAGWLWGCGVTVAVAMAVALVVWRLGLEYAAVPHVYHEEIFVPVSAAAGVYVSTRSFALRSALTVMFLTVGLLTLKNTGFLATVISAVMIGSMIWRRRTGGGVANLVRRALLLEFGFIVVLGVAALVLFAREVLPSGTPELRLVTYALRIQMFLRNPVLGNLFVGSPNIDLDVRTVQSHSDVLDLLAFGGLTGFLLLAAPMLRLLRAAHQGLLASQDQSDASAAFLWMVFLVIGMEMLFNPIWSQPHIMFFFWLAVGYGLAKLTQVATAM